MTFDEALEVLGLPARPELEAARVAYVDLAERADRRARRKLRAAWRVVRDALLRQSSDAERVLGPYRTPQAPAPPTAAEVRALVTNRKPRKAARVLSELYEAAAGLPHVEVPSPQESLELMFRLHERNAIHFAARLSRSFHRWLAASDDEDNVLRQTSWSLADELDALPVSFSVDVRVVLARAARIGDVRTARVELENIARRDPVRTRRDAQSLREHCPRLKDWFEGALDPKPPPRVVHSTRPWSWSVLVIVVAQVAFALMRRSPIYSTPANTTAPTAIDIAVERRSLAQRSAKSLETDAVAVADESVEHVAGALADALGRQDCTTVRSSVTALEEAKLQAPHSLHDDIDRAVESAKGVCPATTF